MEKKSYHWILLRGLMREKRHWGGFTQVFSEYGIKVSCLELPGVGTQANLTPPSTISKFVPLLTKQLDTLISKEDSDPLAILGISMGGMIALEWMAQYPKKFKAGVIINSSAKNFSPFYHRLRPSAIKTMSTLGMVKDPYQREKLILKMTSNLKYNDGPTQKLWGQLAAEIPVNKKAFLGQLMAAKNFLCKKIDTQTTKPYFFASIEDQMVNPICSYHLSNFYQAPLIMHQTAGHDLPLDDPTWVVENILREVK